MAGSFPDGLAMYVSLDQLQAQRILQLPSLSREGASSCSLSCAIKLAGNMASAMAAWMRRANPAVMLEMFQRGNPGRAQRALYGGRGIGVGNTVSFSEHK